MWASSTRQLASLRRAGCDETEEALEKEICVFYNLITEGIRNHTLVYLESSNTYIVQNRK